ncbi:DUF4386 domain-containing protein [Dactylosporangium aurantiacum]|uniref:DUF4386 domain-containing protein n=1 Tax=Dactylosporangium aurantiacum TaxID=35754 RepID=UPI000B046416|nr:DUF4386 domain-containing protein [Dactylosporangium aurantiacum]MDG6107870.1 DUF4386 domain-containing protein [Dactylosporangium aurantiacum]
MDPLIRTARVTGLLYLGLAGTGGLGFLLVRSRLFVDGDPAATLANLVAHQPLARAGVALELLVVLTQALPRSGSTGCSAPRTRRPRPASPRSASSTRR